MKSLLELLHAFIAPTANAYLDDSGESTRTLVLGGGIVYVVLVISAGVFVDASTAVLVAAGGMLVAVIAVFWSSLRTLLGETPLSGADAYVFGAPPRVEEEEKRAVLRALKDIEFERSVGKISEEDYAELVKKYRARAKELLQVIDEKSKAGRDRAETLVQKKLRQAGLLEGSAAEKEEADGEAPETTTEDAADKPSVGEDAAAEGAVAAVAMILATKRPAKKKKKKAKEKPAFETVEESSATNACSKCGTSNDVDAVFCKKCGTRVGKAEESKEAASEAPESESNEEADA